MVSTKLNYTFMLVFFGIHVFSSVCFNELYTTYTYDKKW